MPIYKIQTPDGQILRIEGPENASESDLIRTAQEYMASQAPPSVDQEPSIGDQTVGALETLGTVVTGATGGTVGTIGGTIKGVAQEMLSGQFGTPEAAQRIAQEAAAGGQYFTYQPQTESGQQQVQTLGKVLAPTAAIAPMSAQMAPVSQAVRQTAPIVGGVAVATQRAAQRTGQAVAQSRPVQAAQQGIQNIRQRLSGSPQEGKAGDRSVGAAQVDLPTLRQADVDELGMQTPLTLGQRTNTLEDRQFEQSMSRMPEGKAIRDRFADQNQEIQQKVDSWIDDTGATLTDLRDVGAVVDDVLVQRSAKDRTKIKTLYKDAENAGEMKEKVSLRDLALELERSSSAESLAPIIKATRDEMIRLGGLVKDQNGNYIVKPMTLKDTETLRKFINKGAGSDKTNIGYASSLKSTLDAATEGKGGELYKRARKARAKYARDYENATLTKQLLGTKRGSDDRAIALENMVDKIVLSPSTSLDQMIQVRRLLQTKTGGREGPGAQAWKEVQGATLRHIKDKMLSTMQKDERGNFIVSPSALNKTIKQLDKSGKLEALFDKKGAQKIRTLNDVAQHIFVSPPGSVNYSNTTTVMAGLFDVMLSGSTGIPVPLASGVKALKDSIKDHRIKAKIENHLSRGE